MKKILIFIAVVGMFTAMTVTSCTPKQTSTTKKTDSISVDSTKTVDTVTKDTVAVPKLKK